MKEKPNASDYFASSVNGREIVDAGTQRTVYWGKTPLTIADIISQDGNPRLTEMLELEEGKRTGGSSAF